MTRLVLIALLMLLISGPAFAEWVEIGSDDDEMATIYVDPDTIRRKADRVKMWYMENYKTSQTYLNRHYYSSRVQSEFDCVEELSRSLEVTAFVGKMAKGSIAFTNSNETKWTPVAPGSIGLALWKIACGKK